MNKIIKEFSLVVNRVFNFSFPFVFSHFVFLVDNFNYYSNSYFISYNFF